MSENKRLKNVIYYLISQELISSQEDFAFKLGYNSSSLSQIVTGAKPLSKKFAQKVVNFHSNINPNYLFGDGAMLKVYDDLYDKNKSTYKINEETTYQLAEEKPVYNKLPAANNSEIVKELLNRLENQSELIGQLKEENRQLRLGKKILTK
ncbi:MAG: hypothetical protein LBR81_00725 [Prevotellaceae bacterium]|jgi:transcriptional regulator with XRE-family HTH domain|nr:hypothetical protein [Prevotellaceae bacterium]